jgi:FtsP/CotA-like multicopper oxidase with cupredoxin domain
VAADHGGLSRRRFLRLAATGVAAAAGGSVPLLLSCGDSTGPGRSGSTRSPLRTPGTLGVSGASLTAAPGLAGIGGDESAAAWLYNGLLPGPTIRARRGDRAQIRLLNQLAEPTIVHWHGLLVPEDADGHPRYAVGPGERFDYDFTVEQRGGTFWYHPHPHHLTAGQIHRGLAGFFIIGDEEEDALGLPTGEREVLLLLQDRDGDAEVAYGYAPTENDLHAGMLRDVPFGNGIRLPTLNVTGARYRFRVLNASQARVYRLGLSDGTPLTVIGNDGGLLNAATDVDSVFLGVGERLDFLLDFASVPIGSRLMLKSLPFDVAGPPASESSQGVGLDLLELRRVEGTGGSEPELPSVLSSIPPLGPPVAERLFVLQSTGTEGVHRINDLAFEMERVDEQIPLGQVERWVFRNDSALPHPMHLHGTQFQVQTRVGGRGTVYPYESGWKDTVLVMPLETVSVLVRFEQHRGIFLLHCHNLQHEDLGMMLNVEVT